MLVMLFLLVVWCTTLTVSSIHPFAALWSMEIHVIGQMLDCGSVFPWIRRPCERGGKAPLRGRCVWHSKTVSTPTYCASVALDKLHHGTSYLSTEIKIFHDHQQTTIASRSKYARYGNWDVSESIRICYTVKPR